MKVSHWSGSDGRSQQGSSFSDRLAGKKQGAKGQPGADGPQGQGIASGSNSGFSSGELDAPDGQARDTFPPSLAAYVEMLRSVAAYLREVRAGGLEAAVGQGKDLIDSGEPTTFAVGEEDRGDCGGPPDATTLAVGEEDGGDAKPPVFTTQAVGEEDGGGSEPPILTTQAIGEEDGGGSEPPVATTLALGEEDGGGSEPPVFTTQAIGEEDDGGPIPVEPDGGIGDGAGPPEATTLAVGEEDGGHVIVTPDAPPSLKDLATTMAVGEEDGGPFGSYNR